jgi:Glycosyltransferase family 87
VTGGGTRAVAGRRGAGDRAPRGSGQWKAAGCAGAAAVVTGLVLLAVQEPALGGFGISAAWLAFAAGAWLVLRTPPRRAVPVILLGAVAIQLAALSAPPRTSTDLYRYIWDGRVQAAGTDPYRYVPAAPQLTRVRDPFLWPAHGPICITAGRANSGPSAGPGLAGPGAPVAALAPGCTRINRPGVHTIYPPVAEAYFAAVAELSPPGGGSLPIQAAAASCAIATAVLLLAGLRRLGRDPRLAVLWAWCPLTGLEAGNNAHVDVLAAFLTAAALLTLARDGGRRRAACGAVLLGLAIAAKITPVLAVPAVLRRRPATLAVAGAAATGIVYLPHLLAVGGGVIGFLPGYLEEEGYGSGHRFRLLSLVLPGRWATLAAVTLLAAVAVAVLRGTDPDRPWRGALAMSGAALAVTTPPFAWYAMLLVVLVAIDGRAEWLALAVAAPLGAAGYATALAVVAAASLLRRLRQPSRLGLRVPRRASTVGPADRRLESVDQVSPARPGSAAARQGGGGDSWRSRDRDRDQAVPAERPAPDGDARAAV